MATTEGGNEREWPTLQEENVRLAARVQELEGEVSVVRMAGNARVEGVTDRANAKIFALEEENARLESRVKELEAITTAGYSTAVNSRIMELERELADTRDAAVSDHAAAEKAQAAIDRLGRENISLKTQNDALEEENRGLRTDLRQAIKTGEEMGTRLATLDAMLASEEVPEGLQKAIGQEAEDAWRWFRETLGEIPPQVREEKSKGGEVAWSHQLDPERFGEVIPCGDPNCRQPNCPSGKPEPLNVGGEQIAPGATGPGSEAFDPDEFGFDPDGCPAMIPGDPSTCPRDDCDLCPLLPAVVEGARAVATQGCEDLRISRLEFLNRQLHEAGKAVLRGFEDKVFIRDIAGDGEAGWAIKLLPYVKGLVDLQMLCGDEGPPEPETDWKAEAERLVRENAELRGREDLLRRLMAEKETPATLAAALDDIKAYADTAWRWFRLMVAGVSGPFSHRPASAGSPSPPDPPSSSPASSEEEPFGRQ